eukprot:CAMPEP_0204548266 /NCGR_PEP_ID=MMETSP0661-20131031/23442_1 /ASSEMBLY_ACC=CAM_ASM_000606 /TAXON_ID=109239 /ORGANISM="Alexandrium margalefi, Strain AMGDE01CS-322" /LENGTH=33 /DNA_ID= /DNA_START= /DNA_END= /DNA_ORIENTATION=
MTTQARRACCYGELPGPGVTDGGTDRHRRNRLL